MTEYVIGTNPCPRCRRNGNDRAGNNFTYYGDGKGGYCFACSYTVLSDEQRSEKGLDKQPEEDEVTTREQITPEEIEQIKGYTGVSGKGARGISDDTYKWYAVRTKYDEETGDPHTQYYPYFEDEKLAGFKLRVLPKDWTTVGKVSSKSELFGLFRYRNSGAKTLCLTAGEVDCMSLRDALVGYSRSKGNDYEESPVVSMVNGEKSSAKQLKAHYKYFDKFDKIIYFPDNDEVGQDAIAGIVKCLPEGKVFIAKFNGKDVNELTSKGRSKEIVSAFFNAKAYVPKGIVGSGEMYDLILAEARAPKVRFPDFMDELNDMTGGGISLKTAVAISAATGLAKSTIINQFVYQTLFDSPYKVGAVSMEQSAAQYGELMLSMHCRKKIGKMQPADKVAFLESDYAVQKQQELFFKPDGTHRWHVLDERDGSIEALQAKILELIIACDCQIIVIDTVSDVLDGTPMDVQQAFTKWIKQVLNKYAVAIILICHQRKSASGAKDGSQGAMGTESDIQGSSTIVKSVAINIMLARDKLAEDLLTRNTTIVGLTKNRSGSETSNEACKIYYDSDAHWLYSLKTWLAKNGTKDF